MAGKGAIFIAGRSTWKVAPLPGLLATRRSAGKLIAHGSQPVLDIHGDYGFVLDNHNAAGIHGAP
ncbi:MAG: hypothetical protein ABFD97_13515 [Syntrophobacter sp.]